jgi:hypothetical protein
VVEQTSVLRHLSKLLNPDSGKHGSCQQIWHEEITHKANSLATTLEFVAIAPHKNPLEQRHEIQKSCESLNTYLCKPLHYIKIEAIQPKADWLNTLTAEYMLNTHLSKNSDVTPSLSKL